MKLGPNTISILILILICLSCQDKSEENYPNIIFILADDMGYGDIGALNPDCKINTKNLNQMASEGIRFTDAHSPSSVCTPTRYGIVTGRYSWRSHLKNGVLTGKSKALIPQERSTVASLLKKHNYETGFIGKWHLGWNWGTKDSLDFGGTGWNPADFDNLDFTKNVTHIPNDLGFHYAYGHSGSLDMAPYVYVENGKITSQPDRITVDSSKYTWWREGPTGKDFIHDDVTPNFFRRSIDFITEKANGEKPFFLYLALPSPHTPILPTKEYLGKSELNPYADFILLIDDYIGQINKVILDSGIEQNTLIIFTSDNGCSPEADFKLLAEKGHHPSYTYRGHKADIYEGGHRVPFIAKWPAKIEPNQTSDQTICLIDLMATCADIVDYTLEDFEGEDSYSLMPILLNENRDTPIREATVHHSVNGSFAIRKDQWKLIFCPGSGGWSFPKPNEAKANKAIPLVQLYDLVNDPSETKNLQNVNPDIVNELTLLMKTYIEKGRSTPGKDQSNDEVDGDWDQIAGILGGD